MAISTTNLDELAYISGQYASTPTLGIGGKIKQRNEDFLVEELPLYEPNGEGEHLYLLVEKSNMTTSDAQRRIAKAFRTKPNNVGYAGMKDKHAVTRQCFSVYLPNRSTDEKGIAALSDSPLNVLWTDRHANKLRRGHLRGNRFVIRVRDVAINDILTAKKTIELLEKTGVPNYLGEQRFGYLNQNAIFGKLLIKGEYQQFLDTMLGGADEIDHENTAAGREAYDQQDYATALKAWPKRMRHERQLLGALANGVSPTAAVKSLDSYHLEFLVNALQSDVFNRVLDQRIRQNTFDKLLPGDLAWKHDSRAIFEVDQATADLENAEDGRMASHEICPSGPMWGPEMARASGVVDEMEVAALQATGLTLEDMAVAKDYHAKGVRRPMRIALENPEVSGGADEHGPYVKLAFDLPRGAFATVVLREVLKHETD